MSLECAGKRRRISVKVCAVVNRTLRQNNSIKKVSRSGRFTLLEARQLTESCWLLRIRRPISRCLGLRHCVLLHAIPRNPLENRQEPLGLFLRPIRQPIRPVDRPSTSPQLDAQGMSFDLEANVEPGSESEAVDRRGVEG